MEYVRKVHAIAKMDTQVNIVRDNCVRINAQKMGLARLMYIFKTFKRVNAYVTMVTQEKFVIKDMF
jgi:hypothetical protein